MTTEEPARCTQPTEPLHPEATCGRCGGPNVTWSAPSPLWNAVMRGGSINGAEEFDGIVCPVCFAQLAEERGIAKLWRFSAEVVLAELETVTPSGRTWDEAAWRWREPTEEIVTALTVEEERYKTHDLTDEALAEANRWHAIVHPAMAEAGVYEPDRNPSGCDRFFCLDIVVEISAHAAPRIYAEGVSEGRRQAAEEIAKTAERQFDAGKCTASYVFGMREAARLAEGGSPDVQEPTP